eukprot:scaffold952_cov249-Pinguiococcus_pyrenoidosus.AAC.28
MRREARHSFRFTSYDGTAREAVCLPLRTTFLLRKRLRTSLASPGERAGGDGGSLPPTTS